MTRIDPDSPVVSVRGLHKAYGDHVVLQGVDLSVRRGEIYGLLGRNGAGKTTTAECLQGLRRRDGGDVDVLGLDPARNGDALRRRIGIQLQSAGLPDRLRVGEALALFARLHPDPVPPEQLARRWDLTGLRRRPWGALSGGERQRLLIAIALVGQPELVIFDELTTALDPQARRATWELIREVRRAGTTVLLVSHQMEEVETLCDRLAIIHDGTVVAEGAPADIAARAEVSVTVSFTCHAGDLVWLGGLDGVADVVRHGGADGPTVEVRGDARVPVTVAAGLAAKGLLPLDYRTRHPNLEDAFLALTDLTRTPSTPSAPPPAPTGDHA